MDTDSDYGFTPGGVAKFLSLMTVGVIAITIFCVVMFDMIYEVDTVDNGEGMGVPMGSADLDTTADLTFIQAVNGVDVSGNYNGVITSKDIVLVLADNQAVYIQDGALHHYDGVSDNVISHLTVTIAGGTMNNVAFAWAYYPDPDGAYRAYDSKVRYDIDSRVAGIGSHEGDVVISMNNTATSDNTGSDVVVIVNRSADGIEGIKYRWESNE